MLTSFDKEMKVFSELFGLDPLLVKALVLVESGANPFAIRHESHYRYLWYPHEMAEKVGSSYETELLGQKTSWGLLQVMGAVAREYGFKGWFPSLCEPSIALEYGCRHLKKLKERYGKTESDLIASYNAGSPKKLRSGLYTNQRYVDQVTNKLHFLRGVGRVS